MVSHPIRRFCDQQGWRVSDRAARAAYDGASARRLAAFSPDLVVLDSYLYRLSRPMLSAYSGRIINVHHADLLVRNAMGRARFVGLRAVRDAILSGAADTRATVHVVTDEVDDGAARAVVAVRGGAARPDRAGLRRAGHHLSLRLRAPGMDDPRDVGAARDGHP